jgi:carbon storage regulator
VLSRRKNESLVIDGRIRVTVIGIRGGQVRVAIEAPREVPIARSELVGSRVAPALVAGILPTAETAVVA